MFIANDLNKNRIYIDEADEKIQYYCPICGSEVIQRRGQKNAHHFAHKRHSECDSWHYDMSEWHKKWQSKFPVECREVVLSYNDEKHRADVLIGKTVIEFQHSSMSNEEFWKRNNFYVSAGYEIVWLFDFVEVYSSRRIEMTQREFTYRWKNHWNTFWEFDPTKRNDINVFLQFSNDLSEGNCGIEHLAWLSPNLNYFSTKSYVAYDEEEFINIFIPKENESADTDISVNGQYSIVDIQDSIVSVDGYYSPCALKNGGKECFENCDCCMYSTMCISGDSIGKRFSDLYRLRPAKVKASYVSGCLYRFKDIIENWNIDNDKVLNIKYDSEFQITEISYEKDGTVITKDYKVINSSFKANTLLELLQNSNSKVIIARNIVSGVKVKIGNSDFYKNNIPSSIEGYLAIANSFEFYKERRPIYYWEKSQWIKEWEL